MIADYDDFKWKVIKNPFTLIPLETEYPCHFCGLYRNCYYHDDLTYNIFYDYHYYVCKETYEQVLIDQQLYDNISLLKYLLNYYLCEDLKNSILSMLFKDVTKMCYY